MGRIITGGIIMRPPVMPQSPAIVDTAEGDITPGDVALGKTGFAKGEKITGSLVPLDTSDGTITPETVLMGEVGYSQGERIVGTFTPLDTSDGTITPETVMEGYAGYSQGARVVGTLPKPFEWPTDGKTHVWGRITVNTGYDVLLRYGISSGSIFRIDWGDGITDDADSNQTESTHTFADEGDYHIIIERISGTGAISLGGATSTTTFVGRDNQTIRLSAIRCYVGDHTATTNYGLSSMFSMVELKFSPNRISPSINAYALMNNYGLRSIVFPENTTTLGTSTCQNMLCCLSYEFESLTPPTVQANTFTNINPLAKIYVPDGSVEAYKTATNWINFASWIFPASQKT